MSEINREFELTLQSAVREAIARRHPFVTVEHLLYALIHDERGEEVLKACAVNLRRLKNELQEFFDHSLETVPEDETIDTQQTLAFHRVVQRALHHMRAAEQDAIDAGDVLAAIFQEPDSFAVSALRSQDMSRLVGAYMRLPRRSM